MTARYALTLVAFLAAAHTALAQGAPATKAPATKAPASQEQPGLFTRIKRAIGLEKAPAAAPATKRAPATKQDTTKQDTKATDAKAPATKTPATKTPATKTPATKTPATKTPATMAPAAMTPAAKAGGTKAGGTKAADTKGVTAPRTKQGGLTVAPETAPPVKLPVIMREVFQYESEGRRDPFFSLLTTSELRPALVDLRLTGVILDPSGRRSVAIMRDVKDNTQYRVTTGMQLGRMRVALIKARAVIFSIEEFGLNRQDSLVLGDTTKVRAK